MPRIFDNMDQQLLPALCQTIDLSERIGRVLGKHYGLTADEQDYTVNYDIKYRMGREAEEAEGDGE